jgi:F-type H+-transporting ATPase subunit b
MRTGALCPLEIYLGPLAPHDPWEVVVGFVVALLLWLLFAKMISPNLENQYRERAEQIEGGILRAEKAEQEAEALRQEYAAKLASATDEAAAVRERAKAQGAQILAQMKDQAAKESQRLLDQAHAQIEADRDAVVSQLRGEVGSMATALAGKIVGESLDDDARAKRTVDRFLEELAAAPAGAGGAK